MRSRIVFTLALAAGVLLCGCAQQEDYSMYLTAEEVPNAVLWMPAPPAPGSTQFAYDSTQYLWGKEQRLDTARAHKAIREAVYEVDDMIEQYNAAFGIEITPEKTPEIYKVVKRSVETIRLSATKPKATYMRTRPYAYFNEPTLVPEEEEELRTNGSYPSGHTVRGWGLAMVLTEINPSAQDRLYEIGYQWGQSRVISGYHWQSDVDASRMLAAATYARLHSCPAFLKDMKAARREFRRLSSRP